MNSYEVKFEGRIESVYVVDARSPDDAAQLAWARHSTSPTEEVFDQEITEITDRESLELSTMTNL